jgi:hypothetical protein
LSYSFFKLAFMSQILIIKLNCFPTYKGESEIDFAIFCFHSSLCKICVGSGVIIQVHINRLGVSGLDWILFPPNFNFYSPFLLLLLEQSGDVQNKNKKNKNIQIINYLSNSCLTVCAQKLVYLSCDLDSILLYFYKGKKTCQAFIVCLFYLVYYTRLKKWNVYHFYKLIKPSFRKKNLVRLESCRDHEFFL